jgi:hypothetical protein
VRRTAFKQRTSTLKSNGFKRSERKEATAVKRMKTSRPKMTPIRKSAKDEDCTLHFPCCNFDPATVVWAHSNSHLDGKGAGIKARDEEGCYACSACHSWLDGGYAGRMERGLVDSYFNNARRVSQDILRKKGLMA